MSNVINLEINTYEFTLGEEKITMNAPTVDDVDAFQKKTKDQEDSLDATLDFLSMLGLEKEIARKLQINHLETIVNAVSGIKNA